MWLVGGAALWPLNAPAQPATLRRIGVMGNLPPTAPPTAPLWSAFIESLKEYGWVEGQNLSIEARWAGGKAERFEDFASDLVGRNVEVHPAQNEPIFC
jgi:putative tryptophan/tyrosine transport system substrate-binding protein